MIFLDLADVGPLDAGGVDTLVSLRQWAVSRGVTFKLVNPSAFVRETLALFRLDRLFEMSSSDDALVVLAGRDCCRLAVACGQSSILA